jgi:hypothetical protein
MRTQLLEFQIKWKRSFQKSHVHIFFALFRGFGNGDVTIIPKRNKNPIHFTSRFGWQTVGLWYLVSYSSCVSSTFFIYFFFLQLVWIFTRQLNDKRYPRLGFNSTIKPTFLFDRLNSDIFKRHYPPIDVWYFIPYFF